jgi:hypothetical protein
VAPVGVEEAGSTFRPFLRVDEPRPARDVVEERAPARRAPVDERDCAFAGADEDLGLGSP